MASSIVDLLAHLDQLSAQVETSPGDAAACIHILGRLTDVVRRPALGSAERGAVARHFADACHTLAATFEPQPGRLADTAGVLADACGRRADHLADDERWTILTQLAAPVRRCASAVAASGPYENVPQLQAMLDRARELLLTAADDPPAPDPRGVLTEPIPSLTMLECAAPERIALEAVATLAAELQRQGREAFTIRQLLGVCLAAERAARCVDTALGTRTEHQWHAIRDEFALFADRPRRDPATDDPLLRVVIGAVEGFAETENRGVAPAAFAPVLEPLLERLATGCAIALERAKPNLLVPHGPQPLREGRVAEWLRARAYRVVHDDIRPVLDRLNTLTVACHLDGTS